MLYLEYNQEFFPENVSVNINTQPGQTDKLREGGLPALLEG